MENRTNKIKCCLLSETAGRSWEVVKVVENSFLRVTSSI
nr:MAG TPA: hypothetical protein [Caudoviricetes sp.]